MGLHFSLAILSLSERGTAISSGKNEIMAVLHAAAVSWEDHVYEPSGCSQGSSQIHVWLPGELKELFPPVGSLVSVGLCAEEVVGHFIGSHVRHQVRMLWCVDGH